MRGNRTDIGRSTVEAVLANSFQARPLRRPRSLPIEVHRDPEAAPDLVPGAVRGVDRIAHGSVAQGHERHHVGRPGAGMLALVACQIQQFESLRGPAHRGFHYRVRRTGKSHHAAIVIRVGLPAQQQHARRGLNRVHDGTHNALVAAFGKVHGMHTLTCGRVGHRSSIMTPPGPARVLRDHALAPSRKFISDCSSVAGCGHFLFRYTAKA